MYNSFVVSIFAKAWEVIIRGYDGSLIKKIVDLIKKIISYLCEGSSVMNFFASTRSLIEESFFYNLISRITDFISGVFREINKYIFKSGQTSLVYKNVAKLFVSEVEVLRTFFVFTFFFGLGLIGNNIVRGFFSGRSYIIAMVLIIGSLIGLGLKERYKQILDNSWFFGFIVSIFTIDEGGGNWW